MAIDGWGDSPSPRVRAARRGKPFQPRAPLRTGGLPQADFGKTQAELLIEMSDYRGPITSSEGTTLERLADGAAKVAGVRWDQYIHYVYSPWSDSGFVQVDRGIDNPPTEVFIDGPQHNLRPEVRLRDLMVQFYFESEGRNVVHLGWEELAADPIGTIRRKLLSGLSSVNQYGAASFRREPAQRRERRYYQRPPELEPYEPKFQPKEDAADREYGDYTLDAGTKETATSGGRAGEE